MKIQYLGTGASEAVPALFCDCDVCRRSRETGGRNIRTRSQALIDDTLLVDFPADTYLHVLRDGLQLSKIHTCIITHNHSDHLYAEDLVARRAPYAQMEDETPLNIYGTSPAGRDVLQVQKDYNEPFRQECVIFNPIAPFVPFEAEGYTITALKADHDPYCDPVFYLIEKGGKRLLYANDTGIFPEETWAYLEQSGVRLDFVSLDCTMVLVPCEHGHLGLTAAAQVRQRLMDMGLTDGQTVFYLNHFSHNGGATHDDMVAPAGEQGFLVAYDGLTVEF